MLAALLALVMASCLDIDGRNVLYVVRPVSGGKDILKYNATGDFLPQNKWKAARLPKGRTPQEFLRQLLDKGAGGNASVPDIGAEKAGHTPVHLSPDAPEQPNEKQPRLAWTAPHLRNEQAVKRC